MSRNAASLSLAFVGDKGICAAEALAFRSGSVTILCRFCRRRKNTHLTAPTLSQPVNPARAYFERRPVALFLIILALGLLARFIMLPTAGFALDLSQHYEWAKCANQYGLFGVYQCFPTVTHPPLSPVMLNISLNLLDLLGGDVTYFTDNPAVISAMKLPNFLFETALISLFFTIAYQKAGVWWAGFATAALYWNPGWAVVTVWWGQNDAPYSFLMLLAAYLLIQKRPRWMWLVYGCAMIAKFQSIMFFPVLAVLSLRRFGLRATIEGGLLGGLILGLVVLPFYLGSGRAALLPFGGTVSLFPNIVNGGNNFWWLVSGASPTAILDSTKFMGDVTYFQAGFLLLGIGTAILCWRTWVLAERADEYLVLAVAAFTFYMLPTQVGIRYFYPGLMFLALAMLRDKRLIAIFIVASLIFTHNIFEIVWLGIGLLYYPSRLLFWGPVVDAVVMIALYILVMILFLRPLLRRKPASLGSSSA